MEKSEKIKFLIISLSRIVCILIPFNLNGSVALENKQLELNSNLNAYDNTFETNEVSLLSRQKRYVAFPEGSSLSVAICATIGVVGNPNPAYLSFGMNWGVAYDLPNSSWVLQHVNGFKKHPQPLSVIKRRNKRHLFRSIETAIQKMGYNGRDCIMRALCESKRFFVRKGRNMIEEMLKSIFSLPKAPVLSRERREFSEIEDYDRAYRQAGTLEECEYSYPGCSFSLLDLALGKYSNPPMNFFATK